MVPSRAVFPDTGTDAKVAGAQLSSRRLALACSLGAVLTSCATLAPPHGPTPPWVAARTLEIGRAGAVLSGVAGDGATVFAALTSTTDGPSPPPSPSLIRTPSPSPIRSPSPTTTIEAISSRDARASAPVWHTELDGRGGPLVVAAGRVIAALGGAGSVAGFALRGEPGAALVALDAATGAPAWTLAVDATQWSVIAAVAPAADGVVVGGSFAGTLRIGNAVVSSAGKADGFVARISSTGGVAWLIRFGGPGIDAIQGVAASPDRIAIAGTFTAGADLLGEPLEAVDDRSLYADGFVAELDLSGARQWAQSFGGKADESIAGVAIAASGRVVVAASARGSLHVSGEDLVANGAADGLVAWWSSTGAAGGAVLLGGADFDGLRAIAAAGDRVVVAGFYSGSVALGDRTLTATGGDDAFVVALDATGHVTEVWPISGDGREEITAVAAIPGGFVAGVTHTAAATVGTDALPAPRDPMAGAAIVARPVH